MFSRIVILLSVITFLGLLSCKKKDSEIDYNPNVLSAKDYVIAEDAAFEIVNALFKGIHDSTVMNQGFNYIDCCSIHYYPDSDSMTFGYGEVNRMCEDGKFRRGICTAKFSGNVFEEGVEADIETDSLFIDDLPYENKMQITNEGLNISNHPEFRIQVISSNFILEDTNKVYGVRIVTDYVMEWVEGYLTPQIHEDDTYFITGTASGLSSDNYEFSILIQEPLVNYLDCYWIKSGISQITVQGASYPTGTIDYLIGDGCFNEFHFYFNENLFYEVIK